MQEDKNSRSLSESDNDSEMDNNNITEAPSNQYHDNTTNPSSITFIFIAFITTVIITIIKGRNLRSY